MPRSALVVCVCLLAAPGIAPALDVNTRPVSPVLDWHASDLERFDAEWIHMKFVEGSNAVLDGHRFMDGARPGVEEVNEALAHAGVQEIRQRSRNTTGLFSAQRRRARSSRPAWSRRISRSGSMFACPGGVTKSRAC